MMSENRVLRIIFEPKRKEVAGGYKRLHNEKLHSCEHDNEPSSYIKGRDFLTSK
jgi:hypothetical protein